MTLFQKTMMYVINKLYSKKANNIIKTNKYKMMYLYVSVICKDSEMT